MKFAVYKLNFAAGVHLGTGTLASGANTLPADTLFSALCMEAAQQGEKSIKTLVDAVRQNRLRIGDLFPFIGEELYLPKPLVPVQRENEGNSIVKKSFKKLKYIPVSQLDTYLQGKIDPVAAVEKLKTLGAFEVRTMAASRSAEKLETGETLPYSVGVYRFGQGNGLYTIAGAEDTQTQNKLEQLLNALSYSGIGGKRSAGLGRFTVQKCEVPQALLKRLQGKNTPCVSLSVCMAADEELENALEGAQYLLLRRSGFVSSTEYAEEQRRKRDMYMFCAGSCFRKRFSGDVFDVSNGGRHAVYRYAAPLWMEI